MLASASKHTDKLLYTVLGASLCLMVLLYHSPKDTSLLQQVHSSPQPVSKLKAQTAAHDAADHASHASEPVLADSEVSQSDSGALDPVSLGDILAELDDIKAKLKSAARSNSESALPSNGSPAAQDSDKSSSDSDSNVNASAPPSTRSRSLYAQVKAMFKDVLVVLHFNMPHYQRIPIIVEATRDLFPNMIIQGPLAQEDPKVELCTMAREGAKYECFADMMERHPDYKGYFMFHFDVAIGPWNFARFDPEKIWTRVWQTDQQPLSLDYRMGWRHWDEGAPRIAALLNNPNPLNQKWRTKCFERLGPMKGHTGLCDLQYVPAKYRLEWIEMSRLMREAGVFLELACGTMARCIDPDPEYFFGEEAMVDQRHFSCDYRLDWDFAHPIQWLGPNNEVKFKKMWELFAKDQLLTSLGHRIVESIKDGC